MGIRAFLLSQKIFNYLTNKFIATIKMGGVLERGEKHLFKLRGTVYISLHLKLITTK